MDIKEKAGAVLDWWRCHTAMRWGLVFLPLAALAVWFATNAVLAGSTGLDGSKTALVNAGVFSIRVFAALFFVHLVSHPKIWSWDLPNGFRRELQDILLEREPGNWFGALLILLGETFAKLFLLVYFLRALILWPQGIA